MRIVCELSGGADSALAACMAQKDYRDDTFFGIFVDYGQKYWREERHYSRLLATRFGWTHHMVQVHNLFSNVNKALGKPEEYFPLRNMILSSLAMSYADQIGAEMVITGSKSLVPVASDPYSFQDSTALFYNAINFTAQTAGSGVRIRQILAENRTEKVTKKQVYDALETYYGIGIFETFNCYHPKSPYEPVRVGVLESCQVLRGCVNCREKEAYRKMMHK